MSTYEKISKLPDDAIIHSRCKSCGELFQGKKKDVLFKAKNHLEAHKKGLIDDPAGFFFPEIFFADFDDWMDD